MKTFICDIGGTTRMNATICKAYNKLMKNSTLFTDGSSFYLEDQSGEFVKVATGYILGFANGYVARADDE